MPFMISIYLLPDFRVLSVTLYNILSISSHRRIFSITIAGYVTDETNKRARKEAKSAQNVSTFVGTFLLP